MWIRKSRTIPAFFKISENFTAMQRNVCIYKMVHPHFSLCLHFIPFDFKSQNLVAVGFIAT